MTEKEKRQLIKEINSGTNNIKKIWTIKLHWEDDHMEETSFYKKELAQAYMLGLATANHKKVYGSLIKYTFNDGTLVIY